jgi:hypothetical protein
MTLSDDGYLDGGKPYSESELKLMEEIPMSKEIKVPDEPKKGLTQRDFENTLQMLNAVNAGALVPDLAEMIPRIWDEARFYGKGTDFVATHPVMVLWISKIASLSYSEEAPIGKWPAAYNYIKARIDGLEIGKNIPIWLPEGGYPSDE